MSGTGIIPYGLAGNWCEECGRAKSYRMWPGVLTGCMTCDEVVTRHRCTKRPDLETGQSWECPDCGTLWTAREEEDTCGECGHGLGTMRRTWDPAPGDRISTAPRRKPEPCSPLRNLLSPRPAYSAMTGRTYMPPSLPKDCYRTLGGTMVHIKPGCRCKR